MVSYKKILKDGLLDNNPTLVQLIGMCPTLAVTTSVVNALGMGVAVIAVLTFSNLFISLLRKIIPQQVRIAAFIVVISGFVTAVELILKAFFPAISASLGLFIPLIVVNCIILARAEAFASKNPPLASVVDGLAMGSGFTVALVIIGFIRELLGTGKVFASSDGTGGVSIIGKPAIIFIAPAGAFFTLAFIVAAYKAIRNRMADREEEMRVQEIHSETGQSDYYDTIRIEDGEDEVDFYDEDRDEYDEKDDDGDEEEEHE